jgi:hypothetical protein
MEQKNKIMENIEAWFKKENVKEIKKNSVTKEYKKSPERKWK